MTDRDHPDDARLAQWVREAGDPHVAPDPHYAETLRATILEHVARAQTTRDQIETSSALEVASRISRKGAWTMRHSARIALLASAVAVAIALVWWLPLGGSKNLAFAAVAEALEHLRTATYDVTSEVKGGNGQPSGTSSGKGFFLAPSHQRMELLIDMASAAEQNPALKSGDPAVKAAAEAAAAAMRSMPKMTQISIVDGQAGKLLMLTPMSKMAVEMDLQKLREYQKKMSKSDLPADQFEWVRRVVREGNSSPGEKVEPLGKKMIDGHEAVGFHAHSQQMGDMLVWADPQTARPVRIELSLPALEGARLTMSNFHYDVDLDPALFRLEAPADYMVQTADLTVPVEDDLLRTLRTIAEHNDGVFPAKFTVMSPEVMKVITSLSQPKIDSQTQAEMDAAREQVLAKYGGEEGLRKKFGESKQVPPEILAEIQQATVSIQQKITQKQMKESLPLIQKQTQGLTFYQLLTAENDPHYAGEGVKLGTADRPILWYKPTGAEKYRVVYADLSIQERTADEVRQFSQGKSP